MSASIRSSLLVASALVAASAGSAFAQSGQSAELVLDEITVIGTRASNRSALDSPVPVDVLPAAQLSAAGAVAGELGQALAVVAPSFNFPRQSNSGSSDLVRAGQLRGLSPDQTLVLVNGKRRHTSSVVNTETKIGRGTAAVDFNTIPLNAVERIEVLRDGAGAQYGSDAIAGVVNVVLDRSEGFEANVTVGAHVTDLEPIDQNITDGHTYTVDAKYGWKVGSDGFAKVGINYRDRDSTNRSGFDLVPFFEEQTPANLGRAGRRNYKIGDPNVTELNLWYNTEFAIFEGVDLYSFATITSRESEEGGLFYRYPDSFSNVPEIFPNGFRPDTVGDDQDIAVSAGLKSSRFGGWDLDGGLTFGRNRFEFGVQNSLNASLGPDSPTSFRSGTFRFQQVALNLDAVREFEVDAFEGPFTTAFGAEYRREDYRTFQGDPASFAAGPFDGAIGSQGAPGLTPADEADVDRDVISIYADLSADVTEDFFVNVAGRFEDYSDFGSAITGKAAARYEIADGFALRGAISNSFRAPNLAQVGFADTTLNFGDNRTLISTRTLPVTDPIAQALGAEELEEEKSFNLSAGITAQVDALSVSIDVFRIDVDDRVTLSERLFGGDLAAFLAAQGSPDVQSVRFFTNAVDTRTKGIDVVATYSLPVADGDLSLSGAFNYSKTDIQEIRATTAELTAIDPSLVLVGVEEINTLQDAAPKTKLVLTAAWDNDRLDLLARGSRYGKATRVFNFGGGFEPSQTYGAEWQLDLEAGYQVTDYARIAVGASNLLDNYPDLSNSLINFFDNLPYDILSPIGVNGRYVYSKATVSF